MRSTLAMAALIGMFTSGCRDEARPAYEHCVDLQAKGDVDGATAFCRTGVAANANSTAGKLAAQRLDELQHVLGTLEAQREAAANLVATTVTGEWCGRLRQRLQSRYFAEAARDYPDRDPSYVRQVVTEGATNDWDDCVADVGKATAGYWDCRWNSGMDGTRDCKKFKKTEDEP
jgi:hypothetical protein